MARKLPSNVPFASLLAYSPRGQSDVSKQSRTVCYGIKGGKTAIITAAVTRLNEHWQAGGMADYFGPHVILVPAPRSSPLVAGALRPTELICQEMIRQGLAAGMVPALIRTKAVPKSAFAKFGERPTVTTHLESMEAAATLLKGAARITVVDDVMTKGPTLYAGCVLVKEAAPDADVRAFGLVRTKGKGLVVDIEQILEPVTGTLQYKFDNVVREP